MIAADGRYWRGQALYPQRDLDFARQTVHLMQRLGLPVRLFRRTEGVWQGAGVAGYDPECLILCAAEPMTEQEQTLLRNLFQQIKTQLLG